MSLNAREREEERGRTRCCFYQPLTSGHTVARSESRERRPAAATADASFPGSRDRRATERAASRPRRLHRSPTFRATEGGRTGAEGVWQTGTLCSIGFVQGSPNFFDGRPDNRTNDGRTAILFNAWKPEKKVWAFGKSKKETTKFSIARR